MSRQVGDLMMRNDRSIDIKATISEALAYMQDLDTPAVPVCASGGSVMGVLTQQRCHDCGVDDPDTTSIGGLLAGELVTIDIDARPEAALQRMSERRARWLVVQECGLLAGLVDWDTLAEHIGSDRLARIQKRALQRRRGPQAKTTEQAAAE